MEFLFSSTFQIVFTVLALSLFAGSPTIARTEPLEKHKNDSTNFNAPVRGSGARAASTTRGCAMKKYLLLLISFCSLCLQNGCGGGASGTTQQPPPPVATHLSVSPGTSTATGGTAFNFTIAALDTSNNVVSSYAGTVHFSSSDAQAVLPPNATLTNGTGTFSATLNTVGNQMITATDTVTSSITGTSIPITVSKLVATHFSVVTPANETAGTSFTFTVNALDASNTVVTTYAGTVHFSSSDTQAVLPSNKTLTNGTGTFTGTLKTAGTQSITATDTTTASITGASAAVNVVGGPATYFSVTAPASASAGSLFSFTVTAFDASNNVASGYIGTIHFSSSDPQAILPANSALTGGTADFAATLKTIGTQSIKATDTVTASISGSSLAINVSAATAENPVPFLDQPLVPTAVVPGARGFTLTVKGTGFVPGSVVNWNTKPRVTSFVSNSKLTATILAADVANASTAAVTVVNPAPGGGASNVVFFEVTLSTPSVSLKPSDLGSGTGPLSVAVGDFNGDAKLDMVVIYSGSNTVNISLGNGDGTFQPSVDYPSSSFPFSAAIGDFNADGKLDLVVANQNGSVSVFLGKGDGTFQPAVTYLTGMQSFSVAVGDFNGDGKLDVVTANYGSNDVSVLLGNGDGTFESALSFPAGSQPGSVAIGDFNGDGKLDLAVTQSVANMSVLLGNGDGTFQAPMNYAAGANPTSVVIGDFNGDGKLDLAVADFGTQNGGALLLGNGDGTFQSAMSLAVGTLSHSLAAGDFNGDGKLDLVVTNFSGKEVSILLGNGDGTFQAPMNYAAETSPVSVAVGDFNGDGRLDFAIAVFNNVGASISLLLQDDSLRLSPASLSFGSQLIGTASAAKAATLTNTGFSALAISNIAIAGTGAADFGQSGTCGSGLTARSSCTANITFTPTQIGPRAASLIVTDDAAGSPQSVALDGIGLMTGHNATLAPTSLTFNPQNIGTESAVQSVRLSNYGTTALSISGIAASANFGESGNCGSSLASGASCTITVTFTPTSSGTLSGTLSVTDDASGSPQTVSLSGIGAAATTATLTPGTMSFSCVARLVGGGCTPPQRATLTNTGASTLYVHGITISGLYFSQTNNCTSSLEPGQSCAIAVSFNGPASRTQPEPKMFTGSLIVSDTATPSTQGVSLTGTTSGVP